MQLSRKWAEFYEKSKKEDQLIDLFRQVRRDSFVLYKYIAALFR